MLNALKKNITHGYFNMNEFDAVLIYGDSFCANRDKPTDWPAKLGALLECRIHGYGISGTSWWTARNSILNEKPHNKSTVIRIIIHTETGRLPNDYEHPINTGMLFTTSQDARLKNHQELVETAIKFYKSDLFSIKFYTWAQQAWIKELDEDTGYYATIHIPAFDSIDLTCVRNGIVVIPSLEFRSLRELSVHEIGQPNFMGYDSRSNHFSDTNNVNLAKAIASIISNLQPGDTGVRNFDNLHEWNFDNQSHSTETVNSLDFKSLE
jgi:hypothetical protein